MNKLKAMSNLKNMITGKIQLEIAINVVSSKDT